MRSMWGVVLALFLLTACLPSQNKFKSPKEGDLIFGKPSVSPPPASPTPTPAPSPSATPVGLTKGPLRVQGSNFVNRHGEVVYLAGAIICCEAAKDNGWPFINMEALQLIADHKANFTHVRLGPNTPTSEGLEFSSYKNVGNNKVDLNQWNPAFWQLLRQVIERSQQLGIYVEITLIDAWVLERPEIHAWGGGNNINGINEGDCSMMQGSPRGVHENWLRKIVAETGMYDNVIYEVGNETFDCEGKVTPAWEIGVARIMRDELTKRGYGLRLIGTNSHHGDIENHFEMDYINRHDEKVQSRGNKPIMVNEYNGNFIKNLGPDGYAQYLRNAYNKGTGFHLWRGDLNETNWKKALQRLRDFHTDTDP